MDGQVDVSRKGKWLYAEWKGKKRTEKSMGVTLTVHIIVWLVMMVLCQARTIFLLFLPILFLLISIFLSFTCITDTIISAILFVFVYSCFYLFALFCDVLF